MKSTADRLWNVLTLNRDFVVLSDSKAVALITTDTILTGVLSFVASKASWWTRGAVIAVLMLAVASAVQVVFALLPRLNRLTGEDDRASLIYFGHIASRFPSDEDKAIRYKTRSNYVAELVSCAEDDEEFAAEIAEQVWVNAHIADQKHRHIYNATRLTLAAICIGFVAALLAVLGA